MLRTLFARGLLSLALLSPVATAVTLHWARAADPATLDPHAVNTGTNVAMMHQMYEPLLTRAEDGALEGALATAWQLSEDPAVWRFTLRQGVRFHDGAPFTAEDVVFSLQRAQAPGSQFNGLLSSMVDVVAEDAHTVAIRTAGPNLIFPQNLTNVFIMSAQWAKRHGAEQPQDVTASGENYATRHVNGTGPYQLVTREPDVQTVMQRYPDYWGRDRFPLEVAELRYVPIRAPATRVAALLSGEIDLLQDVPPQDVERLRRDPRLRLTSGPENRSIFLGLNIGAAPLRHSDITDRNPLADTRVRQAIALAIDRDALHRAVMRGQSVPSAAIVPTFVNGYRAEDARYDPPDLARARELLADAGYPNGFTLTLHASNDRYVNDEAIATAVAGFLGRIGIRTRVIAQPIALHSTTVQTGDADFFLFGWGVPTYDSAYIFDYLYYTRGKDGRGANNATGYSDAGTDARILALANETDPAQRNAGIDALWRQLHPLQAYIGLHEQILSYAQTRALDIVPNPENTIFFKKVRIRAADR